MMILVALMKQLTLSSIYKTFLLKAHLSKSKARTFWDEGSSRVLIRGEFAEKLGLLKRKVQYSVEVVGREVEQRSGYIYLFSFVDMFGKSH